MKFMVIILGIVILLQPLLYGIRTLHHLSRRPRRVYPILHATGPQGRFSLVA
jgi:hypothetical protein